MIIVGSTFDKTAIVTALGVDIDSDRSVGLRVDAHGTCQIDLRNGTRWTSIGISREAALGLLALLEHAQRDLCE